MRRIHFIKDNTFLLREAEGKAESILELLGEYGQVTETLRQQIMNQRDKTILSSWIKLAARVHSIREFEEKAGLLTK